MSVGDYSFFTQVENTHTRQLWRSDGTNAGTEPVSKRTWTDLNEVTTVNGKLFFDARANDGGGLWVSDGTDAGTQKLLDVDVNRLPPRLHTVEYVPSELTAFDDNVYFVTSDDAHGRELWKTNGTPEGTVLVSDIHPGPTGSDPSDLTVIGDTLYFAADDGVHGREIWSVESRVEADLVGDIDGDGVVGFSDFLVLSANFGAEGNATSEMGDLNDDQTIGFDDFLLLKQNLGRTLPAD